MAKKEVAKSPKARWVPLKYKIPDSIITRFATNMVVQIITNEVKISFYEQDIPIQLNKDQPVPKEIQATCVASVIVTADRLPGFINVLQGQLDLLKKNTLKK